MNVCRVLERSLVRPAWVRSARSLCHQAPEVNNAGEESVEDYIEQRRDKSGLKERHYNIHHGKVSQLSEDEEMVMTLHAQRKLFGKHGTASGISVAKLWPSKEELELEKEWEKVARPHSVQEMISMARKAKEDEARAMWERQEDLKRKVAKLEGWKAEVRERVARQEREAQIAKEKKDRLIEEVRQIVGFQIDPKDERFKEALLQKEREEKKAKKAAKKLATQQRIMEKLRKEAEEMTATQSSASTGTGQASGESSGITPGSPIV